MVFARLLVITPVSDLVLSAAKSSIVSLIEQISVVVCSLEAAEFPILLAQFHVGVSTVLIYGVALSCSKWLRK